MYSPNCSIVPEFSRINLGFDFPGLLARARAGLAQLELELRTALMASMAGQGRAVVAQTVAATRLVVAYFKQLGGRREEEVMLESRQLDRLEELVAAEAGLARGEIARGLATSPLAKWLRRKRGEEEVAVEGAARLLGEAGISLTTLRTFHREEVAVGEAWDRAALRSLLLATLRPLRREVDVHGLILSILAFLQAHPAAEEEARPPGQGEVGRVPRQEKEVGRTQREGGEVGRQEGEAGRAPSWYTCSLCQAQGAHWLVGCQVAAGSFQGVAVAEMEGSYLRDNLAAVEAAVRRRGGECQAVSSSLQAVHRSIFLRIRGEVAAAGAAEDTAAAIAAVCHKLLSLLRLSHFTLKNEFDGGEASFRRLLAARVAGLGGRAGGLAAMLPHGVTVDTLVDWVAQYFRDFKAFGGFREGRK